MSAQAQPEGAQEGRLEPKRRLESAQERKSAPCLAFGGRRRAASWARDSEPAAWDAARRPLIGFH